MLLKSRHHRIDIENVLSSLEDIADKRQEHFVVLTYDASMRLIDKHLVFLGTVNSVACHPREIFAAAIADAASSIIVSHNHPSGDSEPSHEDIETTQQLIAAGIIIGIPLIDHVIVTRSDYCSFYDRGLL